MQVSNVVISMFIVIKVVSLGCQHPPQWAHPDNSHEESLCLSTDVLNLKLSKGTIAFFGVIILTRRRIISVGLYKHTIPNPNRNTNLTLSYLCILLIVTAHDAEVNPGPCRPRHPCQLCDKAVKWSQKGVRCDNCFGWYHTDCISINTHSYEELNHT